jgi:hypothetical protein
MSITRKDLEDFLYDMDEEITKLKDFGRNHDCDVEVKVYEGNTIVLEASYQDDVAYHFNSIRYSDNSVAYEDKKISKE